MYPGHNCVTANLERGSAGSWEWLARTLATQRPALVFGQELAQRERLEELAAQHCYQVKWPTDVGPRDQVVSWVMAARHLKARPVSDQRLLSLLAVHGSYVAAAEVTWPKLGKLTVLSMHASPAPVPAEALALYPGDLPPARSCGSDTRYGGRYFYSDLLLDALADAATRGHVLAAGDLNEARKWDDINQGHTWGAEFFNSLHPRGLHDVTFELWGEERRTRFHPTHPGYQLDVALASPGVRDLVTHADVDPDWTSHTISRGEKSDHAPLWFTVRPSPIVASQTSKPPHQVQVGDWTGVLPASDSATVSKHRRAQGEWRSDTLKWPAGPPPAQSAPTYPTLPNFLDCAHTGVRVEEAGVNLMSEAAREYARKRLPVLERLDAVAEPDRLYRNLLSSQPLAFSVAGELRDKPRAAVGVFAELTALPVTGFSTLEAHDELVPAEHRKPQRKKHGYQALSAYTLDRIDSEWSPPRWAHTNDRSGCDIAACLTLEGGDRMLVTIEVKYTDTFSNDKVRWAKYASHLERLQVDKSELEELVELGCSQVLRQVMLTSSIGERGLVPGSPGSGRVDQTMAVVLARGADTTARDVVKAVNEAVTIPVQFWPLKRLLDAAAGEPTLTDWAARMASRYLGVIEPEPADSRPQDAHPDQPEGDPQLARLRNALSA